VTGTELHRLLILLNTGTELYRLHIPHYCFTSTEPHILQILHYTGIWIGTYENTEFTSKYVTKTLI